MLNYFEIKNSIDISLKHNYFLLKQVVVNKQYSCKKCFPNFYRQKVLLNVGLVNTMYKIA